jgi:hypothetical protein
MDKAKPIVMLIIGLIVGYFLFYKDDSNAIPKYDDSGLPKNCRALILKNEEDFYIDKKFTYEDLLKSIFRNCGQAGSLWEK